MKKVLYVMLFLLVSGSVAYADVIDFDDLEQVGGGFTVLINGYTKDGMNISSDIPAYSFNQDHAYYAGSASFSDLYNEYISFTLDGGTAFTPYSIDIKTVYDWQSVDQVYSFLGYDGSLLAAAQMEELHDGDWHTLYFNGDFADIDSLFLYHGDAVQIDNFVYNVVPEPISCVLFPIGLGIFGLIRRKKTSTV